MPFVASRRPRRGSTPKPPARKAKHPPLSPRAAVALARAKQEATTPTPSTPLPAVSQFKGGLSRPVSRAVRRKSVAHSRPATTDRTKRKPGSNPSQIPSSRSAILSNTKKTLIDPKGGSSRSAASSKSLRGKTALRRQESQNATKEAPTPAETHSLVASASRASSLTSSRSQFSRTDGNDPLESSLPSTRQSLTQILPTGGPPMARMFSGAGRRRFSFVHTGAPRASSASRTTRSSSLTTSQSLTNPVLEHLQKIAVEGARRRSSSTSALPRRDSLGYDSPSDSPPSKQDESSSSNHHDASSSSMSSLSSLNHNNASKDGPTSRKSSTAGGETTAAPAPLSRSASFASQASSSSMLSRRDSRGTLLFGDSPEMTMSEPALSFFSGAAAASPRMSVSSSQKNPRLSVASQQPQLPPETETVPPPPSGPKKSLTAPGPKDPTRGTWYNPVTGKVGLAKRNGGEKQFFKGKSAMDSPTHLHSTIASTNAQGAPAPSKTGPQSLRAVSGLAKKSLELSIDSPKSTIGASKDEFDDSDDSDDDEHVLHGNPAGEDQSRPKTSSSSRSTSIAQDSPRAKFLKLIESANLPSPGSTTKKRRKWNPIMKHAIAAVQSSPALMSRIAIPTDEMATGGNLFTDRPDELKFIAPPVEPSPPSLSDDDNGSEIDDDEDGSQGLLTPLSLLLQLKTKKIHELEMKWNAQARKDHGPSTGGLEGAPGLSLAAFVALMPKYLDVEVLRRHSTRKLTGILIELFEEVDVDGDSSLQWEEFVSYLFHSAFSAAGTAITAVREADEAKTGADSELANAHVPGSDDTTGSVSAGWSPAGEVGLDSGQHHVIDRMRWLPSLGAVAIAARTPMARLYAPRSGKVIREWRAHRGALFDITTMTGRLAPEYALATTGADSVIHLWDDHFRLRRRLRCPTVQMCLSWAPSSGLLYSGSTAGSVHVWSLNLDEEPSNRAVTPGVNLSSITTPRLTLHGHNDMIMDLLAFSNVGLIASASLDSRLGIFDVVTGQTRMMLEGHKAGINSLAYAPEHHFIVSGSFDHKVIVWNPFVDSMVTQLTGHGAPIAGVTTLAGTPQIASADIEGTIKIWDIRTFNPIQTLSVARATGAGVGNIAEVGSLVSVPELGRLIAGTTRMVHFDMGSGSGSAQSSESTSRAVHSTPSEAESDDHTIVPVIGEDAPPPGSEACAVYYNRNAVTLVALCGANAWIFDARHGTRVHAVWRQIGAGAALTSVSMDARQRKVIIGTAAGEVYVINHASGGVLTKKVIHRGREVSVVLHSEMEDLVYAAAGPLVGIFRSSSGQDGPRSRSTLLGTNDGPDVLALAEKTVSTLNNHANISSSDSYLAIGTVDGGIRVITVARNMTLNRLVAPAEVTALAFSNVFPVIVAGDADGRLLLWTVPPAPRRWHRVAIVEEATTKHAGGAGAPSPVCGVKWAPNEMEGCATLIVGDELGGIGVWTVSGLETTTKERGVPFSVSIEPSASWLAHEDATIHSLQWMGDPAAILTGASDGTTGMWDLTGRRLGALRGKWREGRWEAVNGVWQLALDEETRVAQTQHGISRVLGEIEGLTGSAEVSRDAENRPSSSTEQR